MGGVPETKKKGAIVIKDLTSKERLFCTYYSIGRNPREAAVKSGYMFAEKAALKLLKREEIRNEIARLDKQRKTGDEDIASGYYRLAFGCVSDAVSLLFSDSVTSEDIERMDLFNVAEIKRKKSGDIEIKFFDRLRALQLLSELFSESDNSQASSLFGAIEKGALALRREENE